MEDQEAAKVAEQHAKAQSKSDIGPQANTINADEVAFFERIADSWWDPTGPFKPLHKLNPTRLRAIREAVTAHYGLPIDTDQPLAGKRVLDIGCGGGLVSEPCARMGGDVVGVDASDKNAKTAAVHAEKMGLNIDYRQGTAEELAAAGESFDIIINLEVVEHVADVDAYLRACRHLLRDGGIMITSTLSRTLKSYVFAIIGAEYVLKWLPKGAHDWHKFIKPSELNRHLIDAGFAPEQPVGMVFNPLTGWSLTSTDTHVNYLISATTA